MKKVKSKRGRPANGGPAPNHTAVLRQLSLGNFTANEISVAQKIPYKTVLSIVSHLAQSPEIRIVGTKRNGKRSRPENVWGLK